MQHSLISISLLALFDKWKVDFIGIITSIIKRRKKRYINLATDYVTKSVEAKVTLRNDGVTIARFLYEQIITRFNPLLKLMGNKRAYLLNKIIKELTKIYLVKHRKTMFYHSRANGLTRHFNQVIEKILNITSIVYKTNWDIKLFATNYANDLAYKTIMGHNHFFLVFG